MKPVPLLLCLALTLLASSCGGDDAPTARRQVGQASTTDARIAVGSSEAEQAAATAPVDPASTRVAAADQPERRDPPEPEADLDWLTTVSGAEAVVAGDGDLLFTWNGTDLHRITATSMLEAAGRDPGAVANVFVGWADAEFIHWSVAESEADSFDDRVSIVTTYDGTVVCDLAESVHHVTRRTDGTFVAGVERRSFDGEVEIGPVPAFAVDCITAEERPIEPFTVFGYDGEVEVVEHIAGKRFTFLGDAEGNADLLNEDGLLVNDDDYAGSHALDGNGGRVLYGDYGIGASPHLSRHLVARVTSNRAVLWRAELESWVLFRSWTRSTIVAALAGAENDPADVSTAEILVLDQLDGSVVDRRSTTLPLLHVS